MGPTVFTFWEPKDAVPAYLRLCLRTWRRLRSRPVIVLNHGNLREHIHDRRIDIDALVRFPLAVQKDAIMFAVLHEHGGVFMDVDTLVLADIAPLLAELERTELATFHTHLGFAMARPRGLVADRVLTEIGRRLAASARLPAEAVPRDWDHLGNAPLLSVMDALAQGRSADKPPGAFLFDAALNVAAWTGARARPSGAVARIGRALAWRRRHLWFHTALRGRYAMLDRDRHGVMPERIGAQERPSALAEDYRRYWFDSSGDAQAVLRPGRSIIELHNAWTPDWYRALSEAEVLAHECRLSRTLRALLSERER